MRQNYEFVDTNLTDLFMSKADLGENTLLDNTLLDTKNK